MQIEARALRGQVYGFTGVYGQGQGLRGHDTVYGDMIRIALLTAP